jgi:bifunctional NMN adenylyltransferase/nudix hydrolase
MQEINPKFDVTVFIGRFQPIHLGHITTIQSALNQSKKLIIIIGGFKSASSVRSPWSAKERIEMIKICLKATDKKNVLFIPIRDRLYSEKAWIQNIVNEVLKRTDKRAKIALIGHNKDTTSYYLKSFSQWELIETGNFKNINSTDFRKTYFSDAQPNYKFIPNPVKRWLEKYRQTSEFKKIKEEFLFVEKTKKNLTKSSFTVCNCLLINGIYILLIRRKNLPGQCLYALPGGHLEEGENAEQGALRELYEETQLELNPSELKTFFVKQSYFDYPERNPIARYYAHVFYYRLNFIECPQVTADDDALEASWYLLDDLYLIEDKFFADHYQIIQKLLDRI